MAERVAGTAAAAQHGGVRASFLPGVGGGKDKLGQAVRTGRGKGNLTRRSVGIGAREPGFGRPGSFCQGEGAEGPAPVGNRKSVPGFPGKGSFVAETGFCLRQKSLDAVRPVFRFFYLCLLAGGKREHGYQEEDV